MKKRIGLVAAALLWSAVLFGAGWVARPLASPATPAATASAPSVLDEVWAHVRESFAGEVPSDTIRNYGAIRGALSTLNDRWTTFIAPQPRAIERDHLRGEFGGIGVDIRQDDEGRIVISPRPDSPAQQAGIRDGDILIGIDDMTLPDKPDFNDVASHVRGDVGTSVRITVMRQGQRMQFTITRAVIQVPSVEWRVITATGTLTQPQSQPLTKAITPTIGYIAIHQFTERTPSEVKQAISDLRKRGSQAYLIDLRDNGGGLLNAAVDVASEFIDEGVVLIERHRGQPDVTFPVNKDVTDGVYKEPLAVLMNGNTASASEIVAGAIQDSGRGELIGDKSFGKGSVQSIYDLSDGSSVHITSAKWLTPKQRAIDGVGLIPDIAVARAVGEAQRDVDSQLDLALAALRSALTH